MGKKKEKNRLKAISYELEQAINSNSDKNTNISSERKILPHQNFSARVYIKKSVEDPAYRLSVNHCSVNTQLSPKNTNKKIQNFGKKYRKAHRPLRPDICIINPCLAAHPGNPAPRRAVLHYCEPYLGQFEEFAREADVFLPNRTA